MKFHPTLLNWLFCELSTELIAFASEFQKAKLLNRFRKLSSQNYQIVKTTYQVSTTKYI